MVKDVNGNIGLDLPFPVYGFVGVHGDSYIHDKKNKNGIVNKFVLALIDVKGRDMVAAQGLSGFIGDDSGQVISHPEYRNFYKHKNKDCKRQHDENGNILKEYLGSDREKYFRFA